MKHYFKKFHIILVFFIIFGNSTCTNKTSTSELLQGNFADPPEITWLNPKQYGDGFPVNGSILFSTTLPIEISQIQINGVLKDESGNIIPVNVQSTGTYGFEVYPQTPLTINTRYTFTIPSGTQAIGSQFNADKVLSFSTLAVLQPVASSFGTATDGTSTYVFPEGTTSNNASITFSKSVTGIALSATSLHIETDTGCMNCATISNLSGSGTGPYTFTINGLNSGVVYFLKMDADIKDADGNSAASSIKFAVAPVVSNVKNLGSRGMLPYNGWLDSTIAPVVTIDPNGNKYVAGTFFGTTNWGGGARTSDPSSCTLFVVKYDATGNYLWDRVWTVGTVTRPVAIRADATGVYVLSDYVRPLASGIITLDAGVTLPDTAGLETFLIKIDATSSVAVWAANYKSGGNNGSTALEFAPDGKLAVFAYGYGAAMTTMSVTPAPINPVCAFDGTSLAYLTGLEPGDGGCAWKIPVNYTYTILRGFIVNSIGFDANYLYMTGLFNGLAGNSFMSGVLPAPTYYGGTDIFVARVGYTAGTGPVATATGSWINIFGSAGNDSGYSLAVDAVNNKLYVAGSLHGPINPGCSQTACTSVGSAGSEDGFLLAFNTASAVPLWARTIGGTGGNDQSQKVLVYNNRLRVFTKYDMTLANNKTNQFGCAFNNFNGFGYMDLVMSIYDANGNFDGARAFGSPVDELFGSNQSTDYVTQDSAGKMTAVMYMGPGIIDTTPILSSLNPRDVVMWEMQ